MAPSPLLFLLVEALLLCRGTFGFSSGPPRDICDTNLRPGPDHGPTAMTGNGGYRLLIPQSLANVTPEGGFRYEAFTTYTCKLF